MAPVATVLRDCRERSQPTGAGPLQGLAAGGGQGASSPVPQLSDTEAPRCTRLLAEHSSPKGDSVRLPHGHLAAGKSQERNPPLSLPKASALFAHLRFF